MTPNELRQIRESLGLTQEQLARALGYKSKVTVAKWESGDRPIREVVAKAVKSLLPK